MKQRVEKGQAQSKVNVTPCIHLLVLHIWVFIGSLVAMYAAVSNTHPPRMLIDF